MNRLLDIANNISTLTIAIVVTVVLLLVAAHWLARRRRVRVRRDELPPLVFTVRDRVVPGMRPGVFHAPAPRSNGSSHTPSASPAANHLSQPAPQSSTQHPNQPPNQPLDQPSTQSSPSPPPPPPPPASPPPSAQAESPPGASGSRTVGDPREERDAGGAPTGGNSPRMAASEVTVRVPRYVERAPVEYLPGYLEVQAGGDTGRRAGDEIRFPRGRDHETTVILGRDEGPPDTHVTLAAESVSRRHARLQYENGRWKISNLSRTNPTVVNGEELMIAEGARWLYDGDVIELGEVVFRFHER